jgi:leucyl aminopeptidase
VTTYTLRNASPAKTRADAVVVGVVSTKKGPALAEGAADVASAYGRKLRPLLTQLGLTGKPGEHALVPTQGTIASPLLVLVGVGEAPDEVAVRRAAGVAARAVHNAATVALALPATTPGLVRAAAEGYALGGYRFTDYKQDTRPQPEDATEVVVVSPVARQGDAAAAVERAQVVAAAAARVRDLVNTPANDLDPVSFAARVSEQHAALTKGRGAPKVTLTVWDEQQLADEGCGGIVAVGKGSATPPRLVRLDYTPADAVAHVALVGKGITFDTGGYWIKPGSSMAWMKCDMAGAATVVQALFAIAELGLPVRVTALAPLAENMVSGTATRPGDIMTARNGRTVEIINTDAEGRLVLADALAIAAEDEPDAIVDVATLTGAMMVALGDQVAGVMGSDDVVAGVESAAATAGEGVWRMPIPEEMSERIRSSKIADLAHYDGSRWGGGLFAAAFLREFVDGRPWAHLDVAGPAWNDKDAWGHVTAGGTGFGVGTLVEYAAALAGRDGAEAG